MCNHFRGLGSSRDPFTWLEVFPFLTVSREGQLNDRRSGFRQDGFRIRFPPFPFSFRVAPSWCPVRDKISLPETTLSPVLLRDTEEIETKAGGLSLDSPVQVSPSDSRYSGPGPSDLDRPLPRSFASRQDIYLTLSVPFRPPHV